jgi:hypothetical protein
VTIVGRIPPEPLTDPGPLEGRPLRQAMQEHTSRVLARLDDVDTMQGRLLGEIGAIGTRLAKIERRLDKIRPDSDRPVSFHDLEELREEITPGTEAPRPSRSPRAIVERYTGKAVLWLFGVAAVGIIGGLAWDIALRLAHK